MEVRQGISVCPSHAFEDVVAGDDEPKVSFLDAGLQLVTRLRFVEPDSGPRSFYPCTDPQVGCIGNFFFNMGGKNQQIELVVGLSADVDSAGGSQGGSSAAAATGASSSADLQREAMLSFRQAPPAVDLYFNGCGSLPNKVVQPDFSQGHHAWVDLDGAVGGGVWQFVFRPPETTQNLLAQVRVRVGKNILVGAPFDVRTKPAEWLLVHAAKSSGVTVQSADAAEEAARRFINMCQHASVRLAPTAASRNAAGQVVISDVRVVLPSSMGGSSRMASDLPMDTGSESRDPSDPLATVDHLPAVPGSSKGHTAGLPAQFRDTPVSDQALPPDADAEASSVGKARSLAATDRAAGPLKVFVKLANRTQANAIVSGFRFLRKRAKDARAGNVLPMPPARGGGSSGGAGGAARGGRGGGRAADSSAASSSSSSSSSFGGTGHSIDDVVLYSEHHARYTGSLTTAVGDTDLIESLDVSFLPSLNKQYAEDGTLRSIPCVANAHVVTYDVQRGDGLLGSVSAEAAKLAEQYAKETSGVFARLASVGGSGGGSSRPGKRAKRGSKASIGFKRGRASSRKPRYSSEHDDDEDDDAYDEDEEEEESAATRRARARRRIRDETTKSGPAARSGSNDTSGAELLLHMRMNGGDRMGRAPSDVPHIPTGQQPMGQGQFGQPLVLGDSRASSAAGLPRSGYAPGRGQPLLAIDGVTPVPSAQLPAVVGGDARALGSGQQGRPRHAATSGAQLQHRPSRSEQFRMTVNMGHGRQTHTFDQIRRMQSMHVGAGRHGQQLHGTSAAHMLAQQEWGGGLQAAHLGREQSGESQPALDTPVDIVVPGEMHQEVNAALDRLVRQNSVAGGAAALQISRQLSDVTDAGPPDAVTPSAPGGSAQPPSTGGAFFAGPDGLPPGVAQPQDGAAVRSSSSSSSSTSLPRGNAGASGDGGGARPSMARQDSGGSLDLSGAIDRHYTDPLGPPVSGRQFSVSAGDIQSATGASVDQAQATSSSSSSSAAAGSAGQGSNSSVPTLGAVGMTSSGRMESQSSNGSGAGDRPGQRGGDQQLFNSIQLEEGEAEAGVEADSSKDGAPMLGELDQGLFASSQGSLPTDSAHDAGNGNQSGS